MRTLFGLISVVALGCGDISKDNDTGFASGDPGSEDVGAGSSDGGNTDGGSTDGGSTDGGSTDGGSTDGGSTDSNLIRISVAMANDPRIPLNAGRVPGAESMISSLGAYPCRSCIRRAISKATKPPME